MTPSISTERRFAQVLQIPETPRISVPLPKIWVGFALMSLYWLLRLPIVARRSDLTTREIDNFLLLLTYSAWGYWLFCIYRIHKVLQKVTNGTHPISPAKALGFAFIPWFNHFYWPFKWTREVANFVTSRSPGIRMGRYWPGFVLLLGWILGVYIRPGTGLVLAFLVGLYLTRKISLVVRCSENACLCSKTEPVSLAISAGIGAAFAFILAQAFTGFPKQPHKAAELTAILLVSLGLMWFVEPAAEKIRQWFGLEPPREYLRPKHPVLMQMAIFAFLFFMSITHSLLHEHIFHQLSSSGIVLLIGLIASGGITYSWVMGAQRTPRESAKLGLLGGLLIGIFMLSPLRLALANTLVSMDVAKRIIAVLSPIPGVGATEGISHVGEEQPPDAKAVQREHNAPNVLLIALACPIFGLIGGWFLDRRRSIRMQTSLAFGLAISAAAILLIARLQSEFAGQHAWDFQVLADVVFFAAGWWVGVFVYPTVSTMLAYPSAQPRKMVEQQSRVAA
jgi:hypothetical protein